MRHRDFIQKLDEKRVVDAITRAESTTSGEIRVFVSRRDIKAGEDVMTLAAGEFEKLGLTKTRERNGVLLFFMPRAQKFAVLGDKGIDEKCGPAFWESTVALIKDRLAHDHFTEAVTDAVQRVGAALSQHFPRRSDDTNELSDDVLSD